MEISSLVTSSARNPFVLVHGAFFGGWVWREVVSGLRDRGFSVTAPTLTGIGERQHLTGEGVSLSTHVQDLVAHIEIEDLQNINLVAWSYGGMVATGALDRIANRVSSLIYLDAFVPENGKSLYDYDSPLARQIMEECSSKNVPIPPFPFDWLGPQGAKWLSFVEARKSDQPWRTFLEPVSVRIDPTGLETSYIRMPGFDHGPFDEALGRMRARGVRTFVLPDLGHLFMLTHPSETIEAILETALAKSQKSQ